MGFGFRIYFIDEDDKVTRIPLTRFERIRDRDPKESLSEYKNSRIRYAEVILELENKKPVSIARIVYCYLQFDSEGKVDKEYLNTEVRVAISMMPIRTCSLPRPFTQAIRLGTVRAFAGVRPLRLFHRSSFPPATMSFTSILLSLGLALKTGGTYSTFKLNS